MVVALRTLGILLMVGGLLWMVVADLVFHEGRGEQVRLLLMGGAALLAVSLLLSLTGRVQAKVAGKHCPRCGKPVSRGQIYCPDHLKEAVNQFRDSQHHKGEGG